MSQDINVREELRKWQQEKQLRKRILSLEQQLQTMTTQLLDLMTRIPVKQEQEESHQPEENPPSEPEQPTLPLKVDADLSDRTAKTGLAGFWDRLKAPAREGREARKAVREKRQNPSQEPPPQNPQ